MPVFPPSNFVKMCIAIGFEDVGGAKRRVGASIFSACMWLHRNAAASSAARGRRHFHQPHARQTHIRNVNGHPPLVSSLSPSGCYLSMWLQCFAPASSAARGRRRDRLSRARWVLSAQPPGATAIGVRSLLPAHRFFTLLFVNFPEQTMSADVCGSAFDATAHT